MDARALATAPWLRDGLRVAGVDVGHVSLEPLVLAQHLLEPDASHAERFDHAVLLKDAGRWDEADALLTRLSSENRHLNRRARQSSCIVYQRALIAHLRGNTRVAAEFLDRCLTERPSEAFSLALRHVLTGKAEDLAALQATQGSLDADWLVGEAALLLGRGELAQPHWERVARCYPRARAASIHLASSLALMGRTDEAVELYVTVSRRSAEPVMDEQWIVPLFKDWLTADPQDVERKTQVFRVLTQFGRMQEAEELSR